MKLNSLCPSIGSAVIFITLLTSAVNVLAQDIQVMTPDDAKKYIPNVKCFDGTSEYMEGDHFCTTEEKRAFEADSKINLFFQNGQRTGLIFGSSEAKANEFARNLLEKSPVPMTLTTKGNVKRWSRRDRSMYLLAGEFPTVFIAFSPESIRALNLRYKFEDEPDVVGEPLPKKMIPPGRVMGGVFTIFGIQIGESLTFDECKKEYIGRNAYYKLASTQLSPCFERSYGKTEEKVPVADGLIKVNFPNREAPSLGISWSLLMVDGSVEGIKVKTLGVQSQEQELQALTKKFGPPKSKYATTVKNLAGAQFDSFTAIWKSKEYFVMLYPTAENLNEGQIVIYSTVGKSRIDRDEADLKAKNPGREL